MAVTNPQATAPISDLGDPLADQLRLQRLCVYLLQHRGRLLGRRRGDLLEALIGVLVAAPDPLEVEDPEAAELVDQGRGRRADHAVHGRGDQRQLKPIGAERPGDVYVIGIAGPARRDDRDVVESVGAPNLFLARPISSGPRAGVVPGMRGRRKNPPRRGKGGYLPLQSQIASPTDVGKAGAAARPGGDLELAHLDLGADPLHAFGVDRARPKVMGESAQERPEGPALGRASVVVAGGDIAGEEGVPRAHRRTGSRASVRASKKLRAPGLDRRHAASGWVTIASHAPTRVAPEPGRQSPGPLLVPDQGLGLESFGVIAAVRRANRRAWLASASRRRSPPLPKVARILA